MASARGRLSAPGAGHAAIDPEPAYFEPVSYLRRRWPKPRHRQNHAVLLSVRDEYWDGEACQHIVVTSSLERF
jgi:hypothetical protein